MSTAKQNDGKSSPDGSSGITLKGLAQYLNLSPTTVSVVLNYSPLSESIPQETKDRIFEAARALNYRPNYIARSLRNQRTHTIGVLIPELSEGYSAQVLSGVEDCLFDEEYFYIVVSHRHRKDLLERNSQFLISRCVEGILAVDTPFKNQSFLPVVSISGHDTTKGVTNIVLNHRRAAELAVDHLIKLGHKKIALIKGQEFSSDTEVRAETMLNAIRSSGLSVKESLITQLVGDDPTPEVGVRAMKSVLDSGEKFTALLAFNDISAIGAIRAMRTHGISVPEDVSVVGFDDIFAAEYHIPAITTIRQPLKEMGRLGTECLLKQIRGHRDSQVLGELTVEPHLVIRNSTAAAKSV